MAGVIPDLRLYYGNAEVEAIGMKKVYEIYFDTVMEMSKPDRRCGGGPRYQNSINSFTGYIKDPSGIPIEGYWWSIKWRADRHHHNGFYAFRTGILPYWNLVIKGENSCGPFAPIKTVALTDRRYHRGARHHAGIIQLR